MRILFITSRSSFTDQLKNALETNGAEVFYLDDRENLILPKFLRSSEFLWRLTRRILPLRRLTNRLLNEKVLEVSQKIKPDLVFLNKAMIIKKDTLLALKLRGIKTANWFLDNVQSELYKNWFMNYYDVYDYLFMFDSGAKELVKESDKIHYLPLAVDPDAYKETLTESDKKKYSCDVCFVGALYPERERILNIIEEMGINLKIYGWKGWEKSSLASHYYGSLDIKETVKLYNCAKICLNMNTLPAVNGVNLKTFEIPAAGGFQLSDYRKDVEDLFEIGKEIEVFHNDQEIKEKINFYLKNPELSNKIAQAGQGRVFKDHTLKKRVNQILQIITES